MSTDLLATLRREGDLLASMPSSALGAPVPTVPGWTLEHVVRHTGKVHRWANALIAAGPGVDAGAIARERAESLPKGPDCLPAYRESLEMMVATFESVDPETAVETFVGPGTASWWLRRQAHEVSVHRIDAADAVHAAGGPLPEPLDPESAADGVAELTDVQFVHRLKTELLAPESWGKTVHIHGTDVPDLEWTFGLDEAGVSSTRGHAKADVALKGRAADLLLVLCRRRPLDAVTVFGDARVAECLLETTRF
ncbi:MAG: maleylpyruvate isomerase family mycothiol-dependent enzyme [Rhodococcus sp. (in: high G+C Gram-positive bacteria)]